MPVVRTVEGERRADFERNEVNKQAAKAEWLEEQEKPEGKRKGIRQIAEDHDVNYHALWRLTRGKSTIAEHVATLQLLTKAEEKTLELYLIDRARRGFPLTNTNATAKAQAILTARGASEKLGPGWIFRYIKRHSNLKKYNTTPLERTRANGLNPTAVREYFEVVRDILELIKPEPSHIFGMDEVGVNLGLGGKISVIGECGKTNQHDQTDGERENVTVIETICGDGTSLKPTVIFKGAYIMEKWGNRNVLDANITVSKKGYTDNEIGLAYVKDFRKQTIHLADQDIILFADGHNSHCTADALDYAAENRIIIISYPPHTTHALQGLDVACFGPLKVYWKAIKRVWENDEFEKATKENFVYLYAKARERAFTESTIQSAFRATGIIPFNPNIITMEQMAPAQEVAIRGQFALPLPTPARNMVTANRHYVEAMQKRQAMRQVHFENGPSDSSESADSLSSPTGQRTTCFRGSRSSPVLDFNEVLKGTSVAFLTSNGGTPTLQRLPPAVVHQIPPELEPDFSVINRLRIGPLTPRSDLVKHINNLEIELKKAKAALNFGNGINESANAQLVLRDLQLTHMQKRFSKPPPANDRRRLMTGKAPRLLTGEEFRTLKRQQEEEDLAKEALKESAGAEREISKARKAWRDEEVQERKAAQDAALEAWEVKKLSAVARGLKKMPVKPKIRILFPRASTPDNLQSKKKRLAAAEDDINDGEDDSGTWSESSEG